MIEPKWETDRWGGTALVVDYETYKEYKDRDTLRELADCFGMKRREFSIMFPQNRYVALLVPKLLYTYACEHPDEVKAPFCPHCGATIWCWQ